jgi:hypothetical protein
MVWDLVKQRDNFTVTLTFTYIMTAFIKSNTFSDVYIFRTIDIKNVHTSIPSHHVSLISISILSVYWFESRPVPTLLSDVSSASFGVSREMLRHERVHPKVSGLSR